MTDGILIFPGTVREIEEDKGPSSKVTEPTSLVVLNTLEDKIWYNWSKADIIWALVSYRVIDGNDKLVDDLLVKDDYEDLYEELIDFLLTNLNHFKHVWNEFKYNEKDKKIYVLKAWEEILDNSRAVDIKLLVDETYFTNIEVSSEWVIIFVLWKDWFGMSWYISDFEDEYDKHIEDFPDEAYLQMISKDSKKHIDSMNINRDYLIWAIILNFWYDVSILKDLGTYRLLEFLTEKIFTELWDEIEGLLSSWEYGKINIDPFSKLFLQIVINKWQDAFLKFLSYAFVVDEETSNIYIKLMDWENEVCCISKGMVNR